MSNVPYTGSNPADVSRPFIEPRVHPWRGAVSSSETLQLILIASGGRGAVIYRPYSYAVFLWTALIYAIAAR